MDAGSQPTVTVVIGSNAPPERLATCLEALEPQREGVEVLVREGQASPTELRGRFPWFRFVVSPGASVPEHWRDGIDDATGQIVALTIAQMIPSSDWIEMIRSLTPQHQAVSGAIDAGPQLRLVDWAEYFCRYARDMPPFQPRHSIGAPADNIAYCLTMLRADADSYREGFWETSVHRQLSTKGVLPYQTPALLVRQGRSAGFAAFMHQRWTHGRTFARQRARHLSRARVLAGIAMFPAVPVVLLLRTFRLVVRRRRYTWRMVASLPLLLLFDSAWAVGEARGLVDALGGK
jgi:hypothetical protein